MSTTGELNSSSLLVYTVYFMLEGESKNAQLQAPDATPTGCSFHPAMTRHIAPECLAYAVVTQWSLHGPCPFSIGYFHVKGMFANSTRFTAPFRPSGYPSLIFSLGPCLSIANPIFTSPAPQTQACFLSWLFLLQTHCPPVTGLFSYRGKLLGFS